MRQRALGAGHDNRRDFLVEFLGSSSAEAGSANSNPERRESVRLVSRILAVFRQGVARTPAPAAAQAIGSRWERYHICGGSVQSDNMNARRPTMAEHYDDPPAHPRSGMVTDQDRDLGTSHRRSGKRADGDDMAVMSGHRDQADVSG